MVARTNFLWVGEFIGQLLVTLVNTASVLFLLPYFFGFVARDMAFPYFIYFFFGIVTLVNLISIGWHWRRTQQRLAAITAQPAQWLARWSYDQWTWQAYAQDERRLCYGLVAKWGLLFLAGAAVMVYVWLQFFGQGILWPLLAVMGVNLLSILVQTAIVPYYRILNTAPEALIMADGVAIGGAVYFWDQGNVTLRSLTLARREAPTLVFTLHVRKGRNRSTPVVRVPIPAGYEAYAEKLVATLAPAVA